MKGGEGSVVVVWTRMCEIRLVDRQRGVIDFTFDFLVNSDVHSVFYDIVSISNYAIYFAKIFRGIET